MNKRWYKIFELSVKALLAYAKPGNGCWYFDLDREATKNCIKLPVREQKENALFDQLMIMRNKPLTSKDGAVITDLSEVIFYADFSGIFDRDAGNPYYATLQDKAKSLFIPGNLMLDLGGGQKCYRAFERSQSMSRKGVLSFVRNDLYDYIYDRIILGMKIGRCQLSKLYAYNALMFTDGVRIEGLGLDANRVIVVENPRYTAYDTDVITVESKDTGSARRYERVEKKQSVDVLGFDGEGIISTRLAKLICKQLGENHTSFQIRLPFIKGMVHSVDIAHFYSQTTTKYLIDKWGFKHKIGEVDMILTESMVKCLGWLKENNMGWADYWKAVARYGHALYISETEKTDRTGFTELNYQFLNTLSITADEFRPRDLPLTFPADDEREWLTKATEQEYYLLCCDNKYRREFFTERRYEKGSREFYLKRLLMKNPKLIGEAYYADMLKKRADKVLQDYALGRLKVAGEIRYLSGDLFDLLMRIDAKNSIFTTKNQMRIEARYANTKFRKDAFFAPGADLKGNEYCTLLRNPHIARNEEVRLKPYSDPEWTRKKYFEHLRGVAIVNWDTLTAERLGGADFDGDMVKIITNDIVNRCVARNYLGDSYPLLKIPSEEPVISDSGDWEARFETVKNTFSTRIGQISNAALNRSIIAYNENNSAEERERCRKETETLAILTGLEIDSVKTGIRPDLSEYLGTVTVPRSRFLKYKTLLEKSEERRAWYKPSYKEQFEKFFEKTDWDKVDSNLERLPWLAYNLGQNLKFREDDPADDSELFTFAVSPDWKEGLDKNVLEQVSALIREYNNVLDRIRFCRQPVRNKPRRSDIHRILFMRGQNDDYDEDELYALFCDISAERIRQIRKDIREQKWYCAKPERREELLSSWLPELSDHYELFCDFRCCGFRILGDLICDIDDENRLSDSRRFLRENDSGQFRDMMSAYLEKPVHQDYREAVAARCRTLLEQSLKSDQAIKYIAALGRRRELLELYYDRLEKYIRRCKDA